MTAEKSILLPLTWEPVGKKENAYALGGDPERVVFKNKQPDGFLFVFDRAAGYEPTIDLAFERVEALAECKLRTRIISATRPAI